MLDAASASIVIVDGGGLSGASRTRATIVDLDTDRVSIDGQSSENLSVRIHADNLAYVIFTSGTTGRPKGVMVSHRSLLSIAAAWEESYQLRQGPLRHLQVAGFAFDVFTGDWVRQLATGGTLITCPNHVALDPRALSELIERERIECVELVPALAEPLAVHCEQARADLCGLRLLAVGSDSLRGGLYARLRKLVGHRGRVVNSYGLTEATIDSTYFEGSLEGSREDGPVPIGAPFPGTYTYILDVARRARPRGSRGRALRRRAGRGAGLRWQPGTDGRAFRPGPAWRGRIANVCHGRPSALARGRHSRAAGARDGQVKVRGCRVEIAEVEAAIASCPGVREAAAIAVEDGAGGQQLIACVVALDDQRLRVDALRRLLRDTLPRPMIPSRIEIVAALPRTPSGKVHRQTLLESLPEVFTPADEIVRPRNQVEEQLVAIWEELLPFRPIGVTDDFFDLGGHSLLAGAWRHGSKRNLGDRWPSRTCSRAQRLGSWPRGSKSRSSRGAARRWLISAPPGPDCRLFWCIRSAAVFSAIAPWPALWMGRELCWDSRRKGLRATRNTRPTSCAWRRDTSRPFDSSVHGALTSWAVGRWGESWRSRWRGSSLLSERRCRSYS